MPQELGVPQQEVRVLAAAVGQREAARQLGLSENTVKSICYRAGDGQKLSTALAEKAGKARHPNAPNAADILANTLAEGAKQTKLGLTAYAARMAQQAATQGLLEEAPLYKAVADIHGKMHPETTGDHGVTLQFFAITGKEPVERPVIDVEQA